LADLRRYFGDLIWRDWHKITHIVLEEGVVEDLFSFREVLVKHLLTSFNILATIFVLKELIILENLTLEANFDLWCIQAL
jgi:hypothetical protein